MNNIYLRENLEDLKDYPVEVVKEIFKVIEILEANYGINRNIEADLGGYILIAENIVDIERVKRDKLQSLVPEYTDVIECKEGVNWTSSLFLLSSDYAVIVVTTEEFSKFLLE